MSTETTTPATSRPKQSPLRNFRASDQLWDAVKQKAHAEDRSVSDVIRHALRNYLERD